MVAKTHYPSIALVLLSASFAKAADGKLDFNRDVRPILSANCFACHGPDEKGRKAKLRLDMREEAVKEAIVPGDSAKSEVVARIHATDPDEIMPPPESHKKLTKKQKETLARWIDEGAEYQDHWAFIAPKKAAQPESKYANWARNAIDQFVAARLEAENLKPSPDAEREQLIRRVTFDLTGLPPTPAEVKAFLLDNSPDAYEKVVDRLLASPHFGERMALAWMDAARYGDSSVMHADGHRDMWGWRDWVIDAYNSNKPFNEFTIEQLAGDLLPNATDYQRVATGFNRNHATSDEGGAFPEELRVEYVVDRVQTTANVFLGLSMECGQCHDHKYDPISQKEYYQFFAYFNNTKDPGMQTRNGNQAPTVNVPNKERDKGIAEFKKQREEANAKVETRRSEVVDLVAKWADKKATEFKDDTAPSPAAAGLVHHFPLDEDPGTPFRDVLTATEGKLKGKHIRKKRDGDTAIELNGKTTIDFPGVGGFDAHTQAFSVAAWINIPKNPNGAIVSRMKSSQSYRGWDLWLQGGSVGTHIVEKWPENAIKVVSKKKLPPLKWQHVVMTYDGTGKQTGVTIYINGERTDHNVEQDGLEGSILADVPLRIGGRTDDAKAQFRIDDLRIYNRKLDPSEISSVMQGRDPLIDLVTVPAAERTPEQKKALTDLYLSREDETYKKLTAARAEIDKKEQAFLKGYPKATSMIMQDNDKARMTYILDRGAYDSPIKEEVVQPGVPASLPPLPEGAPPNRLGLAQWLTDPSHPLTARVAVNRYWAMLFGRGIVASVMDFGNQGQPPSHPELLDWLAVEFRESGWDIKRMIRLMVTSATYRQNSRINDTLRAKDRENILLARGPRFRLQGEFIRDNALVLSGLLNKKIGGPSVKPYQPPGIWNEVSLNGGLRYKQDKGDKLYRRSMYTYWKRSAPAPNMMIFDAPTREKCVVERARTNTPLQALVTLNDMHFVEASRKLAARVMKEGGKAFEDRVRFAYQLCLSRKPEMGEFAICREVFDAQHASFKATPESADKYLGIGESERDGMLDPVDHAAWTVIANMILNLDELLTRG